MAIWARKSIPMHWVFLGCTWRVKMFFYNVINSQSVLVDVFGSYDFMSIKKKRGKQLHPVSYSRWDSSPLYQTFCTYKKRQWKMSSVTLSLILPWLSSSCGYDTVISSNAGSWLNRLSSSGRNVLADGVSQLPRWLNWHYINTVPGHRERQREKKKQQCKMYRFGRVTLSERQTLGIKWHSWEKAFAVIKAGDDILNHICHSWHSTRSLPFIRIPFLLICPLNEGKVGWKSGWLFSERAV